MPNPTPHHEKKLPANAKLLTGVIIALTIFLAIRYTTLLEYCGINLFKGNPGIVESTTNAVLSVFLFLVLSSLIGFLPSIEKLYLNLSHKKSTRAITLLLLVMATCCVAITGKLGYSSYTDETRDYQTVEYLRQHDTDEYLRAESATTDDSLGKQEMYESSILHPPMHYWLFSSIGDNKGNHNGHSLFFYRMLVLIPLLITIGLAVWMGMVYKADWLMWTLLFALILNFTYLRNYTFIRFGNELLTFIGFSGFLICVYRLFFAESWHTEKWTLLVGFLCFILAFFSKFSMIVPTIAIIGTGILGLIIVRDTRYCRAILYTLACTILAIVLYYLAFHDTPMLNYHASNYASKIFKSLHLPVPDSLAGNTRLYTSTSSIPHFIKSLPFWYGPTILGCLAASLIGMAKNAGLRTSFHMMWLVMIAMAVVGVLLVNPRAQYTAPFVLAAAYFIAKMLTASVGRVLLFRVTLIMVLYAWVETAMTSMP